MFFIQVLVVFSIVYWVSSVVGFLTLSSREAREIPLGIKTGFGFFLTMIYFAALWQIMSIQITWIVGFVSLLLYLYGLYGNDAPVILIKEFKQYIKRYIQWYFKFLVGAIAILFPLFISGNFGPFTEGGGDVSIYADVTKLYIDEGLTSKGNSSDLQNIGKNALDLFHVDTDAESRDKREKERAATFSYESVSPPTAEWGANSIRASQLMGPFLLTPYGAYSFLSKKLSNYNVYYGIQTFLYCLLLVGAWSIFRAYGRVVSGISFFIFLASHGIASVFYNVYGSQALAIACGMVFLNIAPHLRLNSLAGLKVYSVGIITILCMYSVCLPFMLLVSAIAWRPKNNNNLLNKDVVINDEVGKRSKYISIAKVVSIGFFLIILFIILFTSLGPQFIFLKSLLVGAFARKNEVYMGESIPIFGWKFLSFWFGILSQQHYRPFVLEYEWLNTVVKFGVAIGLSAIFLGSYLMVSPFKSRYRHLGLKKISVLYFVIFVILVLYAYLTKNSLYMQAKGAQLSVSYLYFAIIIPLAISPILIKENKVFIKISTILLVILVLFILSLLVPRAVFGYRLAYGLDRAAILEESYFSEAQKILDSDQTPFVLFEPRKSADLYTSSEPFFGSKMVPTRDLYLGVKVGPENRKYMLGSEMIEVKDLPHLWILKSEKGVKTSILGFPTYTWNASRIIESQKPNVVLFANSYERNFRESELDPTVGSAIGKFSFMRNGSAMIFMPGDLGGSLEVTLEPRDKSDYIKMLDEIEGRLKNGELGESVVLEKDGRFLRLKSQIMKSSHPRFAAIARFNGEFWINIRLNNEEL